MSDFLTTKELAELLRIKERKVYDLAASGEIPCARVVGKLLFPRRALETWLADHSSGPAGGTRSESRTERPQVFLGSHDPLLDWALRDSRSGLASFFDGSLDGLERFAAGEGVASGLHLFDPESGEWNRPSVESRFAAEPVVLVEWAWRARGLIVGPGRAGDFGGLADLRGRRLVPRQAEAGSQALLEHLLAEAGIALSEVGLSAPCRTETDAALAVLEGEADAAFGLESLARRHRLDFVPIVRERFDLLVERRAWFEPPFQRFWEFCHSAAFRERVGEGYDTSGLGRVRFNGA